MMITAILKNILTYLTVVSFIFLCFMVEEGLVVHWFVGWTEVGGSNPLNRIWFKISAIMSSLILHGQWEDETARRGLVTLPPFMKPQTLGCLKLCLLFFCLFDVLLYDGGKFVNVFCR